jgi:ABC-2 type transport system ATP-binding protein
MSSAEPSPSPVPADTRIAPATRAPLKCAGLTKVFKDFWRRNRARAVDRVDLEVGQGEVFGLLGPNGSGKSTTVKLILGLLHPTAGRVWVYGRRPEEVALKHQVGYLPEESYLYPFLNARETLDYYGQLFGMSRGQRRKRIDMLLQMVGLEAVQRRPVREYSKGMQRRIGLAQALLNDPQLLILDEPTTGMDPLGTRQIKDLIHELAERGKTVLLCSHLLADVEDVCERVAIMFGGRVRDVGTVDELLVQQDRTALETESLDEQTLSELQQVLERRGKQMHRVDRPRQRLESLFLQIVEQAQAEGADTSGAVGGRELAAFLTREGEGGAEGEAAGRPAGRALVERLVQGEDAEQPGEASAEPGSAPAPAEQKPADEGARTLDALVEGRNAAAEDAASQDETPSSEARHAEEESPGQGADRSVIDRLVEGGEDADANERDRPS